MSTDGDAAEQLREALRFLAHDAREGHSSTLALLDLRRANAESALPNQLVLRIERNALRSLSRIDDFLALARARSPAACLTCRPAARTVAIWSRFGQFDAPPQPEFTFQ